MNNKNLWIVTELFPPDESSTAYILGEIANTMTARYQVQVICGPEVYDIRKKLDGNSRFKLDDRINLLRAKGTDLDKNTFFGKLIMFIVMSYRIVKLVNKHVQKGDEVLMVTNPAPLVVLMAQLKGWRGFGLKILVHDVFPENTKPAGLRLPSLLYRFMKYLFDKAYARADMLIALGRDMKVVLAEKVRKYNPDLRIEIIENWADVEDIRPGNNPLPTNKIVLEYAGNMGRVQGLQRILESIYQSTNPNLEFALWGTGAFEGNLKKYVQEHQMENVLFHGAYLRSQQNEVLNACEIALITLADGMYGLGVPSKTYNILASGKPILFVGDLRSEIALLVQEKKIGFCFDPTDEKGIVDFLNQLTVEKIPMLAKMGKRARVVAETEYAKEIILKKFQEQV